MSSKETPDGVFPIACERCGQPAATPIGKDERDEANAPRAMRCSACNHGWFVLAQYQPITLRRKPDRRAAVREE